MNILLKYKLKEALCSTIEVMVGALGVILIIVSLLTFFGSGIMLIVASFGIKLLVSVWYPALGLIVGPALCFTGHLLTEVATNVKHWLRNW